MQVNEIAQHAVTCWMSRFCLSMVFADGARYDVPRPQKHPVAREWRECCFDRSARAAPPSFSVEF